MKKILILILPFLFSGCIYFNDRGVDTRYYNNCKEYYDSMGIYHKVCDENLIEYQDVKDGANKTVKVIKDGTVKTIEVIKDGTNSAIETTKEYIDQ